MPGTKANQKEYPVIVHLPDQIEPLKEMTAQFYADTVESELEKANLSQEEKLLILDALIGRINSTL